MAKAHTYAARVEDWDRFFEAFLTYKEAAGIVSSATALLAICDLVEAHLATLETQAHDASGTARSADAGVPAAGEAPETGPTDLG
jgi:hypothetical protein